MKKTLLPLLATTLSLSLAAAPLAQADKGKGHKKHYQQFDYAKVIDTQPIYETVRYSEPYEQCHYEERVVHDRRGSDAGVLLGTLIGGAIGNEIGRHKGHRSGHTVAGAVIGGAIGNNIDRKKRGYHVEEEKVCRTVYEDKYKETITGYDVSYRYRGKVYYTTMDEDPGQRIRVAVTVRPVF